MYIKLTKGWAFSPFPQLQTYRLASQVPLLDMTLDQQPPISRPQFAHWYKDHILPTSQATLSLIRTDSIRFSENIK